MDLSSIISMVEKYGIDGVMSIIFLFLALSAIKSKWLANILSNISERVIEKTTKSKKNEQSVRNLTDSDISNHDIFNYIDFWTYSRVPIFRFSTEYRTYVFRKYLSIYLKSYKRNISKYVDSEKYQSMDDAKLSTSLLDLINRIIHDYERECEEVGIPNIVIEKMKLKNNDTISLTIDLIEGICSSQFYSSDKNLLKVYSILNILLSVLESTISNSENVCNSINGQLKGLKFTDGLKTYTEP
jgi:hypothetical protein